MQTFVINYEENGCGTAVLNHGQMNIDAISAEDAVRAFNLCKPQARVTSIGRSQLTVNWVAPQ